MSVDPLSPKRNLLSLVTKAACFVLLSCGLATAADTALYLLKPDSDFFQFLQKQTGATAR